MTISIRQAIADEISKQDAYMRGVTSHPQPSDICSVEFRQGCTVIEVKVMPKGSQYPDFYTIDSAPILTALLQRAIDEEPS